MKVNLLSTDESPVSVEVSGNVTQRDVSPFSEPLGDLIGPDAYSKAVIVNLRSVDVLDSSGVNWLLSCHKRFKEGGGRIILHSLSPVALNVLKVLSMHLVLSIADNKDKATAMLENL